MFIGNNLYARYARYLDLPDREFFTTCLDTAKRHLTPDMSKDDAPIVFCSSLSAQKPEEGIVTRRTVHDTQRVKRRFLMIDADFDAGQEDESDRLRNAIMRFGAEQKTPVMIYPSFSFPHKPRFRAVFLVSRLLDERRHHQAMQWVYEQLGTTSTDESDLRITTNRNLPVFRDDEMAQACYSTFEDEQLQPLDHRLFFDRSDLLPPKRRTPAPVQRFADDEITYDADKLDQVAEQLMRREKTGSYEGTWYLIASAAFDVYESRLDYDDAVRLVEGFADKAAPDASTAQRWAAGNRELLDKHLRRYQEDADQRARARPLYAYAQARHVLIDDE